MIVSSHFLDETCHLRVTAEDPTSSTDENLDYERCAALHNAIVKHAWVATGRDLGDLELQYVWPPADEDVLAEGQERLHPDVISFLERAINLPEGNFYFFIAGLGVGANLWEMVDGFGEDWVALYMSNDSSSPMGVGIVYDQQDHSCKFDGSCHDGDFPDSPAEWTRLETMLSFWLYLIERGKVVALHESIECVTDGDSLTEREHALLLEDEKTGARRITVGINDPWAVVPYAKQDLLDTLDAWDALIKAIHERLPGRGSNAVENSPLYTQDVLERAHIRKDSFAWRFFSTARRHSEDISLLGPALRLATSEELIDNRWRSTQDSTSSSQASHREDISGFPIPIRLGSRRTADWLRHSTNITDQVPWGLYLDACDVRGTFPVEDGCLLALPYSLGANGFASRADGLALNADHVRGEFELYQIGQHPFVPCNPVQLYQVLRAFTRHIESGTWKVGVHGVSEPDTVFQDADTEEGCREYTVSL